MHDDLQAIRDLISGPPLHQALLADRGRWRQLCDGLDGITDSDTPAFQLSAMNAARAALGVDLAPSAEPGHEAAALAAGVSAIRAELEDRLNNQNATFDGGDLAGLLSGSAYLVEKTAEYVSGYRAGDPANAAAANSLLEALESVCRGISERGFDEHARSDAEDAAHIVRTILHPGSLDPKLIEILARVALPVLVTRVASITQEIDEAVATRRPGWNPKPERN